MDEKEALKLHGDIHQAYKDLDHISKLLIERDAMLTDANLELEEKNNDLEAARVELVRTSDYLSNLLAFSPDAIWVLDTKNTIATFNKVAEEITGYSLKEVQGKTIDFLFDDSSHYKKMVNELPTHESYRNIRTTITCKNGEKLELLISLSLLREKGEKGQPIGSMTISKDVTRELKLETALREANERLEGKVHQRTQDLEILSQFLIVLNQVSIAAGQNFELEKLLNDILNFVLELTGFSMGAISIVDEMDNLVIQAQQDLPEKVKERIKRLPIGEGLIGRAAESGFLQIATPQASELVEEGIKSAVAVPLRAKGKVHGIMSLFTETMRDIQEEERDMLLAVGVQAGSAIENARLYEQVQKDIDQLREVDRIKTEFIATISHELRTPLTSIIGFLSYAEMALESADKQKLARYISIALENGQKLAHMIEDLLAMQKLDSGSLRLRLDLINLADLLDDIGKDLNPQLQSKSQDYKIIVPDSFPKILADAEQLERVLTNLITNAIKFSEDPGTVSVKAKHNQDDKTYEISIGDTGIGMPPDVCDKIFDRFYQAENTLTRKTGGAGLGLTIAKRIVEIHGGRLKVESQLNKGSCFTIILPDTPKIDPDV